MPNWKKLLYSGSNGSLNTLNVSTALTASGLNYPSTDGTSGQAIVTDGSGSLSFTTISGGGSTDTGSLLTTASAAGSTITFEKGDGSTFDVTVSANATSADALVTASLAGSVLTFEKGDTSTFDIILPPGGYSGSNATAHLNQTVAAETWSFAHNLDDRYPVFTVFDSNGDIIVPNRVETVDTNNANIYFTTPRTGTVTAVIASSISQISSVTYNFTNKTTVAVTHSLDTRNIHVSVYDENYALVIPESVTLDTLDTVVVTFPTAKSGTVVVAKGGHILSGSAVLAETASYIASSNVDGPLGMDSITSASYALTASYGENFVISGSIDLNGYTWPTTDGTFGVEVLTTDGAGGLTFEIPTNVYETVKNVSGGPLVKGTPVHATGSNTSGNVVGVIAADAIDPSKMPATYILHQNLADEEEGLGIAVGFITGVDTRGLVEGEPVYVAVGGGWTQTKPTGSALIQNLGIVTKVAENGSGVVLGAGRSNDVPNITEGYAWVGNSDQVATATPTASFFVTSGSHALNANDAISSSYAATSSYSSYAVTSSFSEYALDAAHASTADEAINSDTLDNLDSTQFVRSDQSGTLTGDLTVTGTLTAQEFHTEFVSASILYGSGSTKFGDTLDDIHNFTGSVNVTGSITATSFSGVFDGAISSSAQIASDISGSFTSLSSSFESRITPLEASVSSLNAATSSYALVANISGAFNSLSSSIASDIADIIDGTTTVTSASYALTASYALNVPVTASYALTASYIDPTFISASAAAEGFGQGGVTSIIAGSGISINQGTGDVTVTALATSGSNGQSVIAPFAYAYIDSQASGTGIGVTYGAYQSGTGEIDVTFGTAQANTNYAVVTDNASFDDIYLGISGKSTTGFTLQLYDTNGNPASPAAYPVTFLVYGENPIATVGVAATGSLVSTGSLSSNTLTFTKGDGTTFGLDLTSITPATASYALNAGAGAGFPFSGSAEITGSLIVSGSFVDFTQATAISGSSFSGSFFGDGTGLTGLGYGDTKKLNQAVAATTWSFNHNMTEQYPTVTVYNDLNEVVQPSKIEAVSNSTLNLYFGTPTAGTAVAVVGGVALTQEAGFNRTLSQAVAATTWSFAHNLGQKYPQITVYDVNDELIIPGKVEAVDQNNAILYFDTAQAGTVAATVGGTAMTASYADTLTVVDTLLSTQENLDVDTGTETVATVSTLVHTGAFFDYVIKDSVGGNLRAGTVTAVWSAPEIQYTETSTSDIGDTSGVTLAVDISGTDARLRATVSSDNWNIKAFVRAL